MEAVLVGAPGSGSRTVGRALAERHRGPVRRSDRARRVSASTHCPACAVAEEADAGPHLSRVIAADRIVADPAVRARLYRGRHVIWLDVPTDRLIERLRSAVGRIWVSMGISLSSSPITWSMYTPYYFAGRRVDASGSIAATIAEIEPLLAEPADVGTLVLRAQTHGGFDRAWHGHPRLQPSVRVARPVRQTVRGGHDRREPTTGPRWRRSMSARVPACRSTSSNCPRAIDQSCIEQQEELFRTLAHLRIERRDPMVAVGDDVLLEAATFCRGRLPARPAVRDDPCDDARIDRYLDRREGRRRPPRLSAATSWAPSISRRRRSLTSTSFKTSRTGNGAQRWPRSSSTASSATPCSCPSSRSGVRSDAGKLWPGPTELLEIVERCALAKRRLVLSDERDTDDVRIALNLGHTVSNASGSCHWVSDPPR